MASSCKSNSQHPSLPLDMLLENDVQPAETPAGRFGSLLDEAVPSAPHTSNREAKWMWHIHVIYLVLVCYLVVVL
ncbi:hypothetical protein F5X98DRAFT_373158 [Xylaria grammica]|nr:hypothetical protein F5X98DRAFT_373158 [Xylaria grammica]